MKPHRIAKVETIRHPVVQVTFDDGLSGEYDLTELLARGPVFAPLKDETFFRAVTVAPDGRSFEWKPRPRGSRDRLLPGSPRIAIETGMVEELAARHRRRQTAAA